MSLKFIVTGTGRCGTVFMAKLLTSIGVPCGHESIFDYNEDYVVLEKLKNPELRSNSFCSTHDIAYTPSLDLENWVNESTAVADSSYLAVPFLFHSEVKDIPLIHLTRHPLNVVSSFVKDFGYFAYKYPDSENEYNNHGWEDKIYKFCPELEFIEEPIERACWFYIKWNEEIKKASMTRPNLFVQIENINYPELFDFLEVSSVQKNIFSDTKANSNCKRIENFTLDDIPNETIKKLFQETMMEYGYV